MNKICGKFLRIVYSQPGSNFFVFSFKIDPNQDEQKNQLEISPKSNWITIIDYKGTDVELKVGYEVELEIKDSPKYGLTYVCKNHQLIYKNSYENAISFLSSKIFNGISQISAKKVINAIGLDLLENPKKYQNEMEKLIGKKKTKIIIDGITKEDEHQIIYKKFIDNSLSITIFNFLNTWISSDKLKKYLENHCFEMIEQFSEIDFVELNLVAKVFLKNYSEDLMFKYLVLWTIYQLENEGSTIIKIEKIFKKANQFFTLSREKLMEIFRQLYADSKIILHDEDKTVISSTKTYMQEVFIAKKLKQLQKEKPLKEKKIKGLITQNLDLIQIDALKKAIINPLTIITGSPGTGKTLLIDLIMKNLIDLDLGKVELLAPTGKAATQISLKTGLGARTIHSFLKYNKISFDVNEKNPSDAEIIIIDEFSMINVFNFYSILVATPKLKKLILIGDKNQLPSIGAGYLLNDLISSKQFLVSTLNKIYRQSEGSNIIKNALMINENQMPQFNNPETKMFEVHDPNQAYLLTKKYLSQYLKTHQNLVRQQILIPMYAGEAGIDNINLLVQKLVNQKQTLLFKTKTNHFYFNDKVIQLENDTDKNVFNGEIGYIKSVFFNEKGEVETIEIKFDHRLIDYTLTEFNQAIKLAYAISIHKFQGSECDDVLIIFLNEHSRMLTKKLFYTAYTRAIKSVLLISNSDLIKKTVANDADSLRHCNLITLLK